MEEEQFKSKVDVWLILVVFGTPAALMIQGLLLPDEQVAKYIILGIGAFLSVALPLAVFPCKYALSRDHLNIQCGRYKQKIPYTEIERVEESNSWLSAPALSIRRVQISFGRNSQLISPWDRETFIHHLKSRVTNARQRAVK